MNLAEDFLDQIRSNGYWGAGETIVIGVSGGVDSMVLSDLLNQLPDDCRPTIHAAHVNHQLRDESDEEEAFVKEWMKQKNIPLHVHTWNKADHPKSGFEQEARKIRYQFFSEVAHKVDSQLILTAHHRDDQVETVLMRLVRGSSLDELTGISTKRPAGEHVVLRPLLPYSKKMIVNYAGEHAIPWREDESNQSSLYTRNRFRNQIIPKLKQENPAFEQHIYDFSKDMEELIEVVDPLIEEELDRSFKITQDRIQVNIQAFKTKDPGFRKIVLRRAFKNWHGQSSYALSRSHIDQLLEWLETGGPNTYLELPGRLTARKEYDRCIIEEARSETESASAAETVTLTLNEWTELNEKERAGFFTYDTFQQMNDTSGQIIFLGDEKLIRPLVMRHRRPGDRMKVKGLNGSKKIKDIFIDQKVPAKKRDEAWLVTDSQGVIIWLAGYKESPLSLNPLTDTIIYVLVYQHAATKKEFT